MLPTNTSFPDHVRWLRGAAREQGVEVLVELESMRAFLRKGEAHWVLHPQFLSNVNGRTQAVAPFADSATHFGGWRPQPAAVDWPSSKHKLVFKRAAAKLGISVPEFSEDDQIEMKDVVVKRPVGSSGELVDGPYRSSTERPLRHEQGEYYERFIEGDILKAWYWGDQPVGVECDPTPTVVGDGQSTLQELLLARIAGLDWSAPRVARLAQRFKTIVAYDGRGLADVLPAGERQRAEFRHGADLMPHAQRKIVDLRGNVAAEWRVLASIAPQLQQLLPQDLPMPVLYAIDAVRDAQGRIFALKMDSHPVMNLLAYRPMLASLLSRPAPVAPADSSAA